MFFFFVEMLCFAVFLSNISFFSCFTIMINCNPIKCLKGPSSQKIHVLGGTMLFQMSLINLDRIGIVEEIQRKTTKIMV